MQLATQKTYTIWRLISPRGKAHLTAQVSSSTDTDNQTPHMRIMGTVTAYDPNNALDVFLTNAYALGEY